MSDTTPTLIFEHGFDERKQAEARARGYQSHVYVQFADGSRYRVVFYDCVRLQQDLEYEVSSGTMCVADPGMIVLPEVTLENILKAVQKLARDGYFPNFRPV